jgi:hypothetical protein
MAGRRVAYGRMTFSGQIVSDAPGFPSGTSGITAHRRRGGHARAAWPPGPGLADRRGAAGTRVQDAAGTGVQDQVGQARVIVTGWLLRPAVS